VWCCGRFEPGEGGEIVDGEGRREAEDATQRRGGERTVEVGEDAHRPLRWSGARRVDEVVDEGDGCVIVDAKREVRMPIGDLVERGGE